MNSLQKQVAFKKEFFANVLHNTRSSRPEVFCKKGIIRNFGKFTGFSEISKNTFFHRTPLVATSIIRVLTKFAKFTEKHLCRNLFLINLQSWRQLLSATLLKKWLQHRRFSGNIVKFLRTSFLQKTSGGCFCSRKKPLNFSEKH